MRLTAEVLGNKLKIGTYHLWGMNMRKKKFTPPALERFEKIEFIFSKNQKN